MEYSNLKNTYRVQGLTKSASLIIITLLLFLINPLIGSLVLCLSILFSYNTNIKLTAIASFTIALFIGLINSTKVPENDLVWYLSGYLDAGKMPLLDYLVNFGIMGAGKEFVFPLFNYIIYQFVGDNTKLYVIIHSLVSYGLLNFSIYKFGKALSIPQKYIITAIVVMSFTPFIFTMSAILLRQFLASSLLMYILVNKFFYKKNSYLLMVAMVLTHTSTFLFIPFLVLPFFGKPLNKKTVFYYILMIAVIFNIQPIAKAILPLVSNIPVLRYIFTRASVDTTFDLGMLSVGKIITSVLTLLIPLLLIYFFKPRLKNEGGLIHFFNVLLMLVIFILANLDQSELSNRLNFYVWQFFPFVFLLLAWTIRLDKIFLSIVSVLLVFFFIYYLDKGEWTYNIGNDIFYNTLFHYLL